MVIGADILHHVEMADRRRLRGRLHAAAMQAAVGAVEVLTTDIERNYKLAL